MGKPPVTFGQEGDILGSGTENRKLNRIASYVDGARISIQQDPYQGGIEELRTALVCTLNAVTELVALIKNGAAEATPPDQASKMVARNAVFIAADKAEFLR